MEGSIQSYFYSIKAMNSSKKYLKYECFAARNAYLLYSKICVRGHPHITSPPWGRGFCKMMTYDDRGGYEIMTSSIKEVFCSSRLKLKIFYSLNQSSLLHLLSKFLAFLAFIAFKGLKRPKRAEKKNFCQMT